MKRLIFVAGLMLALLGAVFGGDAVPVSVANQYNATNTVTAPKLNGFLEAIKIDVTGTTTQTLTFTSARTGEAVLTITSTADSVERVRFPADAANGVAVAGTTNIKFLCVNDAFTVRCTEAAVVTNTTAITIFTSKE